MTDIECMDTITNDRTGKERHMQHELGLRKRELIRYRDAMDNLGFLGSYDIDTSELEHLSGRLLDIEKRLWHLCFELDDAHHGEPLSADVR